MKRIDTCGKICPAPLIMTKKAIDESQAGEKIEVITDNETAFGNLKDYLCELDIRFREIYEGTIRTLHFTIPEEVKENVQVASFCSSPAKDDYVVVLKGETMGNGDDALGEILLRAFLNSLSENEKLPSAVILYNGGVKLAMNGKESAVALQNLENRGVTIVACGTCVDFFNIKQELSVGIISNMYKITSLVATAGHVVYP
ncbi:MAG: sulfurtransferase-like selenium metabolism protein YedF [Bacteroidales bacterium]